jgi:hypothetical protein
MSAAKLAEVWSPGASEQEADPGGDQAQAAQAKEL